MKDLSSLMKQAQAMQAKMGQAQQELEQMVLLGQAGDGMVKVTLRGTGQITRVDIDPSLMAPGRPSRFAKFSNAFAASSSRSAFRWGPAIAGESRRAARWMAASLSATSRVTTRH